jgi:hypothetical protein
LNPDWSWNAPVSGIRCGVLPSCPPSIGIRNSAATFEFVKYAPFLVTTTSLMKPGSNVYVATSALVAML